MKKFFLFFLGMGLLALNASASFTMQEVEDSFFKNGLYRLASKTIREQESLKNKVRGQGLLFSMGDFNYYFNGADWEATFIK